MKILQRAALRTNIFTTPLSCPAENTILAFARGELTIDTARTLELHIDGCAACGELVADAARSGSGPVGAFDHALDTDALETKFVSHQRVTSDPRPAEPFSPGRYVGRYRIIDSLGAGGMGIVYRAHDPELDRPVALKLLRSAAGSGGSGGHARLLREAQLTAQLTHPNVVSVFEVGYEEGHVYLAMELIEGSTLREWLETSRPLEAVLDAFRQAARGLCAAHQGGVIHRDFKPDNVLVGDGDRSGPRRGGVGRVRVMDFGLARLRGSSDLQTEALHASMSSSGTSMSDPLTATGTVMGTPAYMAPEQHVGHGVDERSDQYAFFVAMYEALYGSRPFAGRSVAKLALQKQAGPPETPARGQHGKIPRWLRAVVRRGLQPDLELRFASMEAVVVALEQGPRRARRSALAAGSGVLGLAAVGLAWSGTTDDAACEDFATTMNTTWGAPAREAVRTALLGTGLPYAEQTWTSVENRLTAYATAWGEARVEACEAAHDQTVDAVVIARRSCLEARRADVAALVRVLSEADEAVTAQAVHAVSQLSPVSDCALADGTEDLHDDPTTRALDDRLREVAALGRAGRYAAALELAREVEAGARAIDHGPLMHRSLVNVGEYAIRTGAFDDAEQALEEAFLGARARGDAPLSSRAASTMAGLLGHRSRTEDANQWLRHAQAELERYEAPPRDRAMLLKVRAAVLMRAGDYESSLREIRGALELLRAELPDDDLLLSDHLNNLANAYYALGRYDEAIEQHRHALELRKKNLGDTHPQVGDSHGNLGAVSFNLGRYDQSIEHHTHALEIARSSVGERSHDAAIVHNNLGGALHAQHQHEKALEHYQASLEIWIDQFGENDPHVALAQNNLGSVYHAQGSCTEALAHFGRALDIRVAVHGQDHPDVAVTLNNQAICLKKVGRLDEARAKFEQALEIQERTLGPTHPDLGHALDNLAVILRQQGRFEASIRQHRRALDLRTAALGEAHIDVGESHYGLGRALLDSGDADAAVPELESALHVLDQAGATALYLAMVRFALARALWTSGERSQRARTLAQQARKTYTAKGHETEAEEVSRWLSTLR
jgi:eukaryotic-like serine/threonine-protein kinase